jgi:hypothetical protein
MVKARCSPATFAKIAELQQTDAAHAAQYIAQLKCSRGPTNPTAYVGVWGPDKGTRFEFANDYTDPATNQTGTCYSNLIPIDASTWDSLPLNPGGFQMSKTSFCNLATVGESPDKQALAKISKELVDTAAVIYKKIQDMEYESRIYYQQHNTLDQQLQKKLNSYNIFYNQLMGLEAINSQPDMTLGGQSEDAQLKARSGYYQYFIWSILAALTFSYTMFQLRR